MRVTTPLTLEEVELLLDVELLLRELVDDPLPAPRLFDGVGLGVGVPLLDGVGLGDGVLVLVAVGVGEGVALPLLEGVGVGELVSPTFIET